VEENTNQNPSNCGMPQHFYNNEVYSIVQDYKGDIMKNKTNRLMVIFSIVLMVVSSSYSVLGFTSSSPASTTMTTKEFTYHFSVPTIEISDDDAVVHLQEAHQYLMDPGAPVLPITLETMEFPLGTQITVVSCDVRLNNDLEVSHQITAALPSVPTTDISNEPQMIKNPDIYEQNSYYPSQWYSYKLSGGLNEYDQHTTFFTLQINPVRYNPVEQNIKSLQSITLTISVKEPTHPFTTASDAYDMIIICADKYASLLEPLVTHKNAHGVMTKIVPLNDIYQGTYFTVQGIDDQEKIKYFIRDAHEQWNISYVMLVGNYNQVPVRYTALETDTGGQYEELEFVTDLYYSDLYNGEGNFSSWDTDGDGIYGEWPYPSSHQREDIVDLVPDVYIGRLACMFKAEVKTMVNKIIDYETTTYGSDWFNTMVVCGGDTFDKSWEGGTDYNEGEEVNRAVEEILPDFTSTRLWVSLDTLSTESITTEVSKGAGVLVMVGHGNPRNWATHNNGDYRNWTGDFGNKNMWKLSNKGMYPILMCGGCHNSKIDVTPLDILRGLLTEGFHYFSYNDPMDLGGFWYSNWVPECWGWAFVRVPNGGTIASMGSTGYGGVAIGDSNHNGIPDCVEDMDGWFETQFFRLYNDEHIDNLGRTYGQTINNYVQTFPVYSDRYECKIVETHILLGDPSLKIGGYE